MFTQAEARAEFAERSVQKLQKEVDRLEGTYLKLTFNLECKINEQLKNHINLLIIVSINNGHYQVLRHFLFINFK